MVARLVAPALLAVLIALPARAQQPLPPLPGMAPGVAPLPLVPSQPEAAPQPAAPGEAPPPPQAPAASRVFCDQTVTYRLARRSEVAPPYRAFVGVWSDAAWTPDTCAALVVETVREGGLASILYIYGPQTPQPSAAGGVLHGTGIIRNGELRFLNADGSQFAFRRFYADMQGQLTTPKGQSFRAVFEETP